MAAHDRTKSSGRPVSFSMAWAGTYPWSGFGDSGSGLLGPVTVTGDIHPYQLLRLVVSSNRFEPLDENEREWLRSSRRARARRTWLTVAGIAIALALLVWAVITLLPNRGGGGNPPAATTVQDRVLADSRVALQDWGRFGVSGDLNAVKASFWTQGPQYKQLEREAPQLRQHPLGPPAYQFVLTGTPQVLGAGNDLRIVRGVVNTSRKGEPTRSFRWDIYMRRDPGAGGRWRLWTVANTPQR